MITNQDLDMKLKRTFDKIIISERKVESYIAEPHLNKRMLEEIYKEEKERRTIIIMALIAAFLFNFSIVLFIGAAIALPFWATILIASVLSIVGLSVVVLFFTLNKLYANMEVIY